MLALKDKCIHPTTKESYLKSLVGGRDNSPEGRQVRLRAHFSSPSPGKLTVEFSWCSVFQRGITHAFVAEFENEEDRKYYLEKDPEHSAFVQRLLKATSSVQAVDFVPGEW